MAHVFLIHAEGAEAAVTRKSRKVIRIELTEAQKKQIRDETGEEVETIHFTVEDVEPPVKPRTGGAGGVTGTFF